MTTEPFEAFVRRYQDMVYATAVRLLGREADAEDMSQTVFLKAFERYGTLGDSPAVAGWLRTVTTNACLNHLARYRGRFRFFSELGRIGDAGDEEPFETPAGDGASPARLLEEGDDQLRLEQALRRLPDQQRVPLVLFHFEGLGYREIADRLDISLGKVKTDIHRGRAALRYLIPHR